LCEGALVFALLPFNPFELVSVRLCRGGGQGGREQSPPRGGFCFQKIEMAETDNILLMPGHADTVVYEANCAPVGIRIP
jgi:hypothetical protein